MRDEGQMIYDVGVRLAWKKKRGNGYVNMYQGTKDRPFQFVTRAKDINAINRNPEMMAKKMSYVGATGKAVYDFYVSEEFYSCLLYTSPSPRDRQKSRMPSSA